MQGMDEDIFDIASDLSASDDYLFEGWEDFLSPDSTWTMDVPEQENDFMELQPYEEQVKPNQRQVPSAVVEGPGSLLEQPFSPPTSISIPNCTQCRKTYHSIEDCQPPQLQRREQLRPNCAGRAYVLSIEDPLPTFGRQGSTNAGTGEFPKLQAQETRSRNGPKRGNASKPYKRTSQKKRPSLELGPEHEDSCRPPTSGTVSQAAEDRDTGTPSMPPTVKPVSTSHAYVERKYRDGLNSKINQLHAQLGLANGKSTSENSWEAARKGDVLVRAIQYIEHTERERTRLLDEKGFLQQRIVSLEKLVKCEDCFVRTEMSRLMLLKA
jgi:Helix-loop-helix DNA-binding domain